MKDNEVWKDIAGFEGLYQVSNFGRVKSNQKNGSKFAIKTVDRILKSQTVKGNYDVVSLKKNKCKYVHFTVHRLVAKAFIPNPHNLPFVNHKDENSKNNFASNLEWCTHKYNINYGSRTRKVVKKLSIPIIQIDATNGDIIKEFSSLHEASKITGVQISHICNVCKGKRNIAGGFIWRYKNR